MTEGTGTLNSLLNITSFGRIWPRNLARFNSHCDPGTLGPRRALTNWTHFMALSFTSEVTGVKSENTTTCFSPFPLATLE